MKGTGRKLLVFILFSALLSGIATVVALAFTNASLPVLFLGYVLGGQIGVFVAAVFLMTAPKD